MFGCHNCSKKIKKGSLFSTSPCADCPTRNDPFPQSRFKEDPATFSSLRSEPEIYMEDEHFDEYIGNMFTALAESVEVLIRLKEEFPETFKFVNMKLKHPSMTYQEIASVFVCRKQNVLYHMRKGVKVCPILAKVLLVDKKKRIRMNRREY